MPLIQTGNIQTYYELHGGSGPVIVFVHGAGASHDMWRPQVEYFSHTFRTLTYDIRGHQQSEGSDDSYTCELFADDLNQLLQQLDIREPLVCGYQSNLKGLILADTAVASALTLSDKLLKAMYPKSMIRWTIKRMSDEKYADWSLKYFDMDDEVRKYLKQEQLKLKKEELLKITDAIYSFKLLPLENIKVPTLVIVGENERKAVFPHIDKMVELIPDAKRVVIPRAGHASNLENPEVFNREVEDFLRGLVVSSA